jgi:outer membrane receptor protein involved in Fe transport
MSPFFVGQGFPEIGSHSYHNVRLSYDTELFGTEETQFYLGITNAFDKEPPFFATSASGTQAVDTIPGYYDIFGRSYFAGVKVKL